MSEKPPKRKVLLIGWDAADWKVIHPMMDAGKMPHLEALVNGGTMGNLATITPVLSPMLWTSIATGKRPFKHGIHGFAEPNPDQGGVRPITNLSRTTKAIWNILGQQGLTSNVIGWWPSHPAEPINGVMVSNHFHRATGPSPDEWPMKEGAVHPPELADDLAQFRVHPAELDANQILPFVPRAGEIDIKKDRRLGQVAQVLAECAGVHACATAVMQNEPWDFMAIYYDAIDHFCHGFMRYHPPRQEHIEEESFELYKDVVESAYRFHDLMLGATLKLVDDDTTVILMSDHGFHPDHLRPREIPREPNGPAIEHSHHGVFVARGPGIKKDATVFGANLLDITPTLLTLFDLPVGEDMDGRVLNEILERPGEIKTIPSWDDVEGDDGQHPEHYQFHPEDERELMKQLVELGYVEEPDDDKATAERKSLSELQFNLARAYVDADRHDDSIPILEKLVDEWPDEYRFLNQLAYSYLSVDRLVDCRRAAEEILRLQKRVGESAKAELAAVKEEAGDTPVKDFPPDLVRKFEVAGSRLRQAAIPQHILFASLLDAEGETEKALETIRLIPEESWVTPVIPMRITVICLNLGELDEAGRILQKTLEMDPQNPRAHQLLMQLRLRQKRYREAAEYGLGAVGFRYFFPVAHHQLGKALTSMKMYERAEEAFKVSISQNPANIEVHQDLAELYQKALQQPDKADEHLRIARELAEKQTEEAQPESESKPAKTQADRVVEERLEIPEEWAEEEIITIVSGLPRSGTSMMMQMLHSGGKPCLTDGLRSPDENNPRGFFELESIKELHRDSSVLQEAGGHAVKVVAPILPKLPMDQGQKYRVIFMERDLDEVHASQAAMLSRLGKEKSSIDPEKMKQSYVRLLGQVNDYLGKHEIPTMRVNFGEAITSPLEAAKRLNEFCNRSLDERAMAQAVDPALYRERKSSV